MTGSGRRVGLIGVGNMGGRIGRRLHETGVEIVGHHPDPEKVRRWGLEPVDSVRALTACVDVVLLCLPDSPVVEAVVTGEDGVLAAAREGQVIVDATSALPQSTRALAAAAAERGVGYVDAPVSGGARSAPEGRLTVMVGGEPDTVAGLRWLFDAIASSVHVMGPVGSGHLTKILNNFLNAVSLAATSEVMVAGRAAGLDVHALLQVLSVSSGRNYAVETRFPSIIEGDYLEGGITVDLMIKDVVSYLDQIARQHGVSLAGSGVLSAFRMASALGYGDQINNRVVDALGDAAGGVRLHTRP
ncbi:3-hydroxyisobutyrate dehydrogenase [Pseudonocardia dioxanivorans CB1190]|uniref:3-hydroxyisobutyrate dehydrogenase n=1 Tax=Pseudonocardia dioxanivorans (strain ATCC 55486 / DSM 44775 / JCM 13855 / CB1190) TaxID=675635 RepID=F4CTP9_PSEUX|nr:NAD(P)-dependent oxidoreductase [Pseudonocardia dioxanivorans]AEA28552.1 3-hydroxyisobutyrate dehydrogenase [Pseudonocardia dioxanivorans CB1190]